jgi:CobQ-like glutamine amidotransferase family enzyme
MRHCLPEAKFVLTELNDVPTFASEKVDMVFMGGMTEDTQELVIGKLLPYKERIVELIAEDVIFLMVSNALEIFGQYIEKEDGSRIAALGLFETYAKRNMTMRFNSLVLFEMEGMKMLGYKSQFSQCYGNAGNEGWMKVIRGAGLNPQATVEGLRRRNFMATYLLGPLMIMNPAFMKYLMQLLGVAEPVLAHEEAMYEAYNKRLAEFEDANTKF